MRSIGFRCWNDRFAFVVLAGTQDQPSVVASEVRRSPKNVDRPEFLAWVRSNVDEILTAYEPDAVSFKAAEAFSQKKDLRRAEVEGVLQEAAYSHSPCHAVTGRVKSQIRKDVAGFQEPARYVGRVLDEGSLSGLKSASFEEAALVAICGLPPS